MIRGERGLVLESRRGVIGPELRDRLVGSRRELADLLECWQLLWEASMRSRLLRDAACCAVAGGDGVALARAVAEREALMGGVYDREFARFCELAGDSWPDLMDALGRLER